MDKLEEISVIIPVYSGGEGLIKLVDHIIHVFQEKKIRIQIVLVFDGGFESALGDSINIKNNYKAIVTLIQLESNVGQQKAILLGAKRVKYQWALTMDEDGQHPVLDVFKLIDKAENSDVKLVYGDYKRNTHGIFRSIFSALILKLAAQRNIVYNKFSSFRLIEVSLLTQIKLSKNVFIDAELYRLTNDISAVRVNHLKRAIGKSSYSMMDLIRHTIQVFKKY